MIFMSSHESARKNKAMTEPAQATAHSLELLEPRKLLSGVHGVDDFAADVSLAPIVMSLNATWFEDLVPQSNQNSGVSVQVVEGEDPQVASIINHEWLIQLTQDASLAAGSVTGAGEILALADIGVQVIRGLGAQGLILVNDANLTGDFSLVDYLAGNEHIEFLASNYEFAVDSLPDDSYFSSLWGLNNTGQSSGTADADIDAPEAWALAGDDGATIVVGVVDTGVDYNHPDLINNMWINAGEIAGNNIDDDGNGFIDDIHGYDFANNDANPMDDNGHGTHVAGTIAATPDNNRGVAGVAPNAQIMALKFMNASGSGSTANAIRALNYATMMNVDYGVQVLVTNNSWGGGGYSTALYNAIRASGQAGMVFIASAGNDGDNIETQPSYPASYSLSNIITVAATDRNDDLASFSNYGVVAVDIAAPGVTIRSTLPNNTYGYYSGTSMAAPHVAGAAAFYLGQFPDAQVSDVVNAILTGGDDIDSVDGKTTTGNRLNLVGMLNEAPLGGDPDPEQVDPEPEPVLPDPEPAPEPSADIAMTLASNPWDDIILPGERGRVSVTFENQGELIARGRAQVTLYLSQDLTLDDGDLVIHQQENYSINLRQGQSRTALFNVTLPSDLPQGSYHLIAVFEGDDSIGDNQTDNDIFVSAQTHELLWMVGDVNGRRNTTLILPDANGNLVRFMLTGAGSAVISGDDGAQTITLNDTDASTRFTIMSLSRGADAQMGDIIVNGSLSSFTTRGVNLTGDLNIDGSVRMLSLDDMAGGTITMGQGESTMIRMGIATDVSLISEGDIRSITAYGWVDTDHESDDITAASIGSLTVRGDMAGDVTTTDANAVDLRATIMGSIVGGSWDIAGGVSTLRATAAITDFTLIADGDIRSIMTGRDGALEADIQANAISSIRAGGTLSGSLTATGTDGRGNAMGFIFASQITDLEVIAAGNITGIRSGDIENLTATVAGDMSMLMGRDLENVDLEVDGGVRTISVYNWDTGNVTADSISTFSVRENLNDVNVELTRVPDPEARSNIVLNSMRIAGVAQGLNLTADGDVNTVMVGALLDSQINIGVLAGPQTVDGDVSFGDQGSIRTFMVRGIRGLDGPTYDSSTILIRQAGSISLQEVDVDDSEDPYGVVADSVGRFSRVDSLSRVSLSRLDEMSTPDQAGSFVLRIL